MAWKASDPRPRKRWRRKEQVLRTFDRLVPKLDGAFLLLFLASRSIGRSILDYRLFIRRPCLADRLIFCNTWGNGDEVITSLVQTSRIVFFKISFFFCFCFFLQKFFSLYNWILVPNYGQMNHRCINMHRCMYGLIELKLHDGDSG